MRYTVAISFFEIPVCFADFPSVGYVYCTMSYKDSTYKKIFEPARVLAVRLVQEIGEQANGRENKEIYPFAALCASLVYQQTVIALARMTHKPGNEKGKKWIERMYEEAVGDTLHNWQDPRHHEEDILH